jgi:hypothetical protein
VSSTVRRWHHRALSIQLSFHRNKQPAWPGGLGRGTAGPVDLSTVTRTYGVQDCPDYDLLTASKESTVKSCRPSPEGASGCASLFFFCPVPLFLPSQLARSRGVTRAGESRPRRTQLDATAAQPEKAHRERCASGLVPPARTCGPERGRGRARRRRRARETYHTYGTAPPCCPRRMRACVRSCPRIAASGSQPSGSVDPSCWP